MLTTASVSNIIILPINVERLSILSPGIGAVTSASAGGTEKLVGGGLVGGVLLVGNFSVSSPAVWSILFISFFLFFIFTTSRIILFMLSPSGLFYVMSKFLLTSSLVRSGRPQK